MGETDLAERYQHQLRVHCYRMLGSFADAEDLVRETFLLARRDRATDSATGRLYRIATNACLDFLDRNPRRPTPSSGGSAPSEVPWLSPYPDRLLDEVASGARETIELAFLVALQHVPAEQRAVLILRDVLGWSARETADVLDLTVAAVGSALRRARPVLEQHLPAPCAEWSSSTESSEEERLLLKRYMAAHERTDVAELAAVVRDDVRLTTPPEPMVLAGLETLTDLVRRTAAAEPFAEYWLVPTFANRQPAAAKYVRQPGDSEFRAQSFDVLRCAGGMVIEITRFGPDHLAAFRLPAIL